MQEQESQPTYHQWLGALTKDPLGGGANGCGLMFSAVGVTLLAVLFGLDLFPPGRYPRLLLMLPGLVIGGLYIYLAGLFFFRFNKILAVLVGIGIGVIAGGFGIFLLLQYYASL